MSGTGVSEKSSSETKTFDSLEAAVEEIFARTGPALRAAAPLGLGKPHLLLNALYDAVAADPERSLHLYTALSLAAPALGKGLQRRFLEPFLARHFGTDFPPLKYTLAQRADALPSNVHVEEFYLQSGAFMGSTQAQRSYASLNYTHVARAVAAKRINVFVQKVAANGDASKLSLSCNPDLTADLLDEISALGLPRPLMVAKVDDQLPFIAGTACVDRAFFDIVVALPGPAPMLFALPRQSVSAAEHAIGLYASTLVKDGGTLQIGIGSLSDALCHALILRHTRNSEYLAALEALSPGLARRELVAQVGGTAPFVSGLYGASEMVNDGFMRLAQAGILVRRVINDVDAMQRINAGQPSASDQQRLLDEGHWLNGGFYLGSHDLYRWLREMPHAQARGLGMTRISHINELYGGNEKLERLQRRDARFFNTCMMMTALGAAVSDGLDDGRVVSGVGGQYNFVAMAHALRDGRSVLLLRATRSAHGRESSSVLWSYGHCTIPRHLRDIVVTEHGIADLRGASDEECTKRMLGLADSRFQDNIISSATAARKLPRGWRAAPAKVANTAASLRARLQPLQRAGVLPDYPLGCDYTLVEQRLVKALAWLSEATATPLLKVITIAKAVVRVAGTDLPALERMQLLDVGSAGEWLQARLLLLALARSSVPRPAKPAGATPPR